MFKKILVPLDGSQLAEWALAPAISIGAQDGAKVILLRVPVVDPMRVPGPLAGGPVWPNQAPPFSRREATQYVGEIGARTASEYPAIAVQPEVLDGDVASVIVDTAVGHSVDLIVMLSHGYSGVTRWLLGSMAETVLGSAPCPVLVLRGPEPIRHVLIPLDGSPIAQRALAPGLEVASALGAHVTLLRVIPEFTDADAEQLERIERGLGRRLVEDRQVGASDYLFSVSATQARPGLELRTLVRFGSAAPEILDFVRTHQVDLIAMSTHGRTGLKRWVYGSVTERVLHSSGRSMLIVRPPPDQLN